MAIGPAMVRRVQRLVGDGMVARWLARTGAANLLRARRDRAVLKTGVYETALLGKPVRLAVRRRDQIVHIDALWREEAMLRRMIETLRQDDVVWDVGANIGLVSLALALHGAEKNVRVHAFEPDADNGRVLQRNIEWNVPDRVHWEAVALADTSGEAMLYLDRRSGGGHSLVAPRGTTRTRMVAMSTGDTMALRLEKPTVAKIDVEGAEAAVLRGMEGLLRQHAVRELFIEVHPKRLPKTEGGTESLRRRLVAMGYERVWRHQRADEWHEHYRVGA